MSSPAALAAPRLHATIEARCQFLATTYPALCKRSVVGQGHETPKRDISCLRIGRGAGRPAAIVVGGVHAREWAPPDAVLNFAEALLDAFTTSTAISYPAVKVETSGTTLNHPTFAIPISDVRDIVEKVDLHVIPLLNPDGRDWDIDHPDILWRKNRRPAAKPEDVGVDLNRNFDIAWRFEDYYDMAVYRRRYTGDPNATNNDPASDTPSNDLYRGPKPYAPEPETDALQKLVNSLDARLFVDVHMFGRNVLWCWGLEQNGLNTTKTWRNPAFDHHRDGLVASDAVAAGLASDYQEYCPPPTARRQRALAVAMREAIIRADGGDPAKPADPLTAASAYTSDVQSAFLYLPVGGGPTPGCTDDYAFSRQFATPGHGPTYAFTIEAGSTAEGGFHPTYTAPAGSPNRVHYPKIEREIHAALSTALLFVARAAPPGAGGASSAKAILDEVLELVGLAAPRDASDEERNVLRYPIADPPAVRHGLLAHSEGGLVTDASLRPRVSVILAPDATFQGVAQRLMGLYAAAAAAGGPTAPTQDQLARALVFYNQHYLPAGTWTEHRVGLRLPLPIEIDAATGNWIVNADEVRLWSGGFDGAWLSRLTAPPATLKVLEPIVALRDAANRLIADNATAGVLGTALRALVLRNPFASVFLLFETLRRLTGSVKPIDVALELLDGMVAHQAALLASTSAGNGVLRRLDAVLAAAPAGTDAVRLKRNRDLLTAALFVSPGGARVPFRELAETPRQLKDRGPVPNAPGATDDPAGGVHRVVLGHDVAVGRVREETIDGVTYHGPAYNGRVLPAPFAAADASNLPGDARTAARMAIVTGIAPNEGNLDAIRMRDAAVVSSGIHQWSAHAAAELPALLFRFKSLAPEEYALFFGCYGLDVVPDPDVNHVGQFILRRIDAGGAGTNLDYNAMRGFFEGAVVGGKVVLGTTWAARFRLASLASEAYGRCQLLEAIGRFDRIKRDVGNVTVGGTTVAVETLISSKQGVALLLDSHVNKPKKVKGVLQTAASQPGLPADADQRDRKITKSFHDTRNVYDRSTRNAGVDAAGFDVAHGSFAGW